MLELVRKIEHLLQSELPDCKLKLVPEVCWDLEQGHYCSDILIRYAQQVKHHPQEIARGLQRLNWNLSEKYLVQLDSGYLNIFLKNITPEPLPDFYPKSEQQIYLPVPVGQQQFSSYLRIMSAAIWQMILSTGQANLIVCGDRTQSFSLGAANLIQQILEIKASSEITDLLQLINVQSVQQARTIWLLPNQIAKSKIADLYHAAEAESQDLTIKSPPAFWFKDLDPEIPAYFHERRGREVESLPLSLLLAGPLPAAEVYLDEAILPQRNNILWYLKMSLKRMSHCGISAKPLAMELQLDTCSAELGQILLLLRLLPAYRRLAARTGAIPEYLEKVFMLLDQLNRFFNTPQLRQKLAKQQLSAIEQDCLAAGLSFIEEQLQLLDAHWLI